MRGRTSRSRGRGRRRRRKRKHFSLFACVKRKVPAVLVTARNPFSETTFLLVGQQKNKGKKKKKIFLDPQT
jgi:hypothetical protein